MSKVEKALAFTSVVGEKQTFTSDFVALVGENVNYDVLATQQVTSLTHQHDAASVEIPIETLQQINSLVNSGDPSKSLNVYTQVWN